MLVKKKIIINEKHFKIPHGQSAVGTKALGAQKQPVVALLLNWLSVKWPQPLEYF